MVNGWSNKYWGWGGEDDDLRRRITLRKLNVWRYPIGIARYTMLPHKRSKANPHRYTDLEENIQHFTEDGLNSLEYDLVSIKREPLYTSIKVDFTDYFDGIPWNY
ncbi:UNVERIFIED_CONTAM: hypothetical protein GTU68_046372 [Idotea baltica]|nr:hypothetical protein [Idotea baltica]